MAHPFVKILEHALRKSTAHDNHVLREAQRIIERGYSQKEVCDVLTLLAKGRIDDEETALIELACEELCGE